MLLSLFNTPVILAFRMASRNFISKGYACANSVRLVALRPAVLDLAFLSASIIIPIVGRFVQNEIKTFSSHLPIDRSMIAANIIVDEFRTVQLLSVYPITDETGERMLNYISSESTLWLEVKSILTYSVADNGIDFISKRSIKNY